jgi:hypothetical protein
VFIPKITASRSIRLARARSSPESFSDSLNEAVEFGLRLFAFLAAGPLAILLSAVSDWNAFYVGVTAPLTFDRAAAGIQPNGA